MPGWAKALIIIVVLLILVVVGIVAAGAIWWSRNKDTLIAKGKAQVSEGRETGKTTDNQGCVDKSIERYKLEPGFYNAIGTSIFMQNCLQNSRPTDGFCADVPKQMEFTRSAQWRIERCQHFELSEDKYCQQLFSPVQQFCEKRHPGQIDTGDETDDK